MAQKTNSQQFKLGAFTQNGCHLYRPPNLSVATGSTGVAVPFDNASYELGDVTGMHDPAANPSRITIIEAGLYFIYGSGTWADSTGGVYRITSIRVNSTAATPSSDRKGKDTGGRASGNTFSPYLLAAGDYVELWLQQDSGAALNMSGIAFGVIRLG